MSPPSPAQRYKQERARRTAEPTQEPARSATRAAPVEKSRVSELESQVAELKAGLARRYNETRAERLKVLEAELRAARGY